MIEPRERRQFERSMHASCRALTITVRRPFLICPAVILDVGGEWTGWSALMQLVHISSARRTRRRRHLKITILANQLRLLSVLSQTYRPNRKCSSSQFKTPEVCPGPRRGRSNIQIRLLLRTDGEAHGMCLWTLPKPPCASIALQPFQPPAVLSLAEGQRRARL
ncbi:hypothetical protein BU26DRAFT_186650 [Trematosphaeria pertusa]|uniref:Uncharacterized protein n=1 Tax=Trematosphaeria pertusa TaxID=390896 RepID=A0A6A6HTE0_9PLEO|nr:uncharacterized protein BU26DRAFT_186650 [Trematosphaeria pertusa]KAF2241052.1 hypothetical protein BU26DRAFT_186650 [Trematosphaeria pertusa]